MAGAAVGKAFDPSKKVFAYDTRFASNIGSEAWEVA
jgi:hypothetical protein